MRRISTRDFLILLETIKLKVQHGKGVNLTLNSFEECEVIKEQIDSDQLHVPKECLVVGITPLNAVSGIQPIIMWPTCQKDDYSGTLRIIQEVNETLKAKTGFPLINLCTDGDGTRRKVAPHIMSIRIPSNSPIYKMLSDIPLIDLVAGKDLLTCNFDPKHLVKRLGHCWLESRFSSTARVRYHSRTNIVIISIITLTFQSKATVRYKFCGRINY